MNHLDTYFNQVELIAQVLREPKNIDILIKIVNSLVDVRNRWGRVFVVGVGGSAGNASHMVNDLRKLCGIEAYAPTDNVSELTAWANDTSMDVFFSQWLRGSNLCPRDLVFVLSVGGGTETVSKCIVNAVDLAIERHAPILGIVGKSNGYVAKHGDIVMVVPEVHPALLTPLSESFQAVIWHALVSDPRLQKRPTTW